MNLTALFVFFCLTFISCLNGAAINGGNDLTNELPETISQDIQTIPKSDDEERITNELKKVEEIIGKSAVIDQETSDIDRFTGESEALTGNDHDKKGGISTGTIIAIVVGVIVLIFLAGIWCCCRTICCCSCL